ncbi:MAG: type II secretion system protein GspL [Pseudohongiellaceae bacterium]
MDSVLVRDAGNGQFGTLQWFRVDDAGLAAGPVRNDSVDALREELRGDEARVLWLVRGESVVLRRVSFTPAERRHLARLLPFQLEQDLAADVESVHVATATPGEHAVTVACVDHAALSSELDTLESAGVTVHHAMHEAQLLRGSEQLWSCLLDEHERVHVRYSEQLALTTDAAMMAEVLSRLFAEATEYPERITLYADSDEGLRWLEEQLRECAPAERQLPGLERVRGTYRDAVDLSGPCLDLRQGSLALPVPYARIWRRWRGAAMAVAAALLVYLSGSGLQLWVNEQRRAEVEQQIVNEYREVMPQGMLVNAASQLRNRLATLSGNGAGSGILTLLSRVTPALEASADVRVQRVEFNARSNQLQLTLEAPSNADILALTEQVQQQGVQARPGNMSAVGDRQRAVLRIGGDS